MVRPHVAVKLKRYSANLSTGNLIVTVAGWGEGVGLEETVNCQEQGKTIILSAAAASIRNTDLCASIWSVSNGRRAAGEFCCLFFFFFFCPFAATTFFLEKKKPAPLPPIKRSKFSPYWNGEQPTLIKESNCIETNDALKAVASFSGLALGRTSHVLRAGKGLLLWPSGDGVEGDG